MSCERATKNERKGGGRSARHESKRRRCKKVLNASSFHCASYSRIKKQKVLPTGCRATLTTPYNIAAQPYLSLCKEGYLNHAMANNLQPSLPYTVPGRWATQFIIVQSTHKPTLDRPQPIFLVIINKPHDRVSFPAGFVHPRLPFSISPEQKNATSTQGPARSPISRGEYSIITADDRTYQQYRAYPNKPIFTVLQVHNNLFSHTPWHLT